MHLKRRPWQRTSRPAMTACADIDIERCFPSSDARRAAPGTALEETVQDKPLWRGAPLTSHAERQ